MPNKGDSKEGVNVYELGYLILPSIAEGELSDVVEKLKAVFTKAGGVEIESEAPFKHPLSYTMSKVVGASRYVVNEAYIGWMKFELEIAKAPEVKDGVEKVQEVLRFLLIKAPRETSFSFAKAKALLAEKEAEERKEQAELSAEEAVAPVEAVVE